MNTVPYVLRRSRTRGFTLVEVLVAMIVISVGLLGIAGLQLTAKRSGHQAWQRGLAVSYANDLVERIRMNPAAAAAYHTGLGSNALGGARIESPAVECDAENCSPAQLASWDLWRWEQAIDGVRVQDLDGGSVGGLIAPSACVLFIRASAAMPNTGQLRVIIGWRSTTETSDAAQDVDEVCGNDGAGSLAARRQVVVSTYVIDPADLGS